MNMMSLTDTLRKTNACCSTESAVSSGDVTTVKGEGTTDEEDIVPAEYDPQGMMDISKCWIMEGVSVLWMDSVCGDKDMCRPILPLPARSSVLRWKVSSEGTILYCLNTWILKLLITELAKLSFTFER